MRTEKLTGRKRYRVHKSIFGKHLLVLQLEEHVTGTSFDMEPNGWVDSRDYDFKHWRDANIEDITLDICEEWA